MSRSNLELQGLMVAAANARRVPTDILSRDFWMEHHASSVTDYTYRGATGWRDWLNDLFEYFSGEACFRIERTVEVAEDFVVTLVCVSGRGLRSERPLRFRWANVTWFRGGRADRAVGFTTVDEALSAARFGCEAHTAAVAGRAEGWANH